MNPFWKGRLRTKLFVTSLLVLLSSYAVLVYFNFFSLQSFIAMELDQHLLESLKLVRNSCRTRTDLTISSLSAPASAAPVKQWVQKGDRARLSDAVRRWHEVLPFLDVITVVDARQRVIARLGPNQETGMAFGIAPLLDRAYSSKEPVASFELVRVEVLQREGQNLLAEHKRQETVLTAVTIIPIKDRQGEVLGGIIAGDVIAGDDRFLEEAKGLLDTHVVAAISQNGRTVASTASGEPMEFTQEIIETLERGLTYHGTVTMDRREMHMISEPLTSLGGELVGAMVVTMSPQRYELMQKENERNTFFSLLLGALLSFVMVYLTTKWLTAPLQELTTSVRRIEDGDLDQRVQVVSSDEVGMLAEAFNRMVVALQERDTTISAKTRAAIELNEHLEARVHERAGQLQAQARLQEEILGSMADGIVVVDTQDRIKLLNPAARQLFGLGAEDDVSGTFSDLCRTGYFCGLRQEIARLLTHGGRAQLSIETGGSFVKAYLTTVHGADGGVNGVVISLRDVTIEEAIDRMKTEFIATVSHELKTPLTSMKGSLQYILGKGKWLTGSERELLEICQRNTDRLIRLITSILDISAIEAGGVQFKMLPQVPSELVINAIEELRGLALNRNVAVSNAVKGDLPLVSGDHDRLIQVLTNLLANAIKFGAPGKVVRVEAKIDDSQLAISIIDSNRTIPEGERGKLFKKFQQIDQGEGGPLGGSGLGLAISKEIVERHGGQIFHKPVLSGGNEFVITIPLYEEQA